MKDMTIISSFFNATHLIFAQNLIKHCHWRCDEIEQGMSTCKSFPHLTPNLQLQNTLLNIYKGPTCDASDLAFLSCALSKKEYPQKRRRFRDIKLPQNDKKQPKERVF